MILRVLMILGTLGVVVVMTMAPRLDLALKILSERWGGIQADQAGYAVIVLLDAWLLFVWLSGRPWLPDKQRPAVKDVLYLRRRENK